MTKCLAQVILNRQGGLPEDVVVNTFHFEDDAGFSNGGGISVNGPGLVTRLQSFYDAVGQAVLSGQLTGTGTVKLYDVADPKPRAPRLTSAITFAATGDGYPGEVAIVLSMRAALVSGTVAARRRGRIYLGPIKASVGTTPTGGSDMRPSVVTLDNLVNRLRTLATGGNGAFRLAVFSPTTAAGDDSLDAAWNDVTHVSADNAFDTQRRRGAAPTLRRTAEIGSAAVPA